MPRSKKPVDPNAPVKEKRPRVTTLEKTKRLLAEQNDKLRKQQADLIERRAKLQAQIDRINTDLIEIGTFLPAEDMPEYDPDAAGVS